MTTTMARTIECYFTCLQQISLLLSPCHVVFSLNFFPLVSDHCACCELITHLAKAADLASLLEGVKAAAAATKAAVAQRQAQEAAAAQQAAQAVQTARARLANAAVTAAPTRVSDIQIFSSSFLFFLPPFFSFLFSSLVIFVLFFLSAYLNGMFCVILFPSMFNTIVVFSRTYGT